jgi:methionyl-tRNA formyltransferase
MKIVIVTSQITYVPENSFEFYEKLLEAKSSSVSGLFVVKNLSFGLIGKIAWLYGMNCNHLANTLSRNIMELRNKKIENLFEKYNIPITKINSVDDKKFIDQIRAEQIDIVINFRARCIFKKELLQAPRLGCINIHHGILPKYRGLFCDLYALYENRPAGFTIHKMTENIDDGSIYLTKIVSKNEKNYCTYLSLLANEEATVLSDFISSIEKNGELPRSETNTDAKIIITKTPKRREIKKMLSEGIIL